MGRISVIVPVYNVEKYLARCIESIISQSFTGFELILVNDGSTDGSGGICDFYKDQDPRITVIHQENQGLSEARNRGIERATQAYISFIDSDDWIHKDMLKILYNSLVQYKSDISVCGYQALWEGQEPEKESLANNVEILNNIEAVKRIVEKNDTQMIIACGKLYKRSLFAQIRYPKGKYHEDEFVTYKLLYKASRLLVTHDKLYYYTQRKKSITGQRYSLKRLEKLEALKEAIDFFEGKAEEKLRIKAKIRYLNNIQIAYYRVKYEIGHTPKVLDRLKEDYDQEYKSLVQRGSKVTLGTKVRLRFFALWPDMFCRFVRLYMKLLKES